MTTPRSFEPQRDFASPASLSGAARARGCGEEEAPAEPTFSVAEVDALVASAAETARREGVAEGEAAARRDASLTLAAAVRRCAEEVAARIDDALAREADVLKGLEVRGVRLFLSLAQKLSAELSDAEAERIAVGLARRAVDAARGAPSVEIKVSEEMLAPLKEALESALRGPVEAGRAVIAADADLSRTAVRVDWRAGAVAYDPQATQDDVTAILSKSLDRLTSLGETAHNADGGLV